MVDEEVKELGRAAEAPMEKGFSASSELYI